MLGPETREVILHRRCCVPDCEAKGEDGVSFYKDLKSGNIFCLEHAGRLVHTQKALKSKIGETVIGSGSGTEESFGDWRDRKDLW